MKDQNFIIEKCIDSTQVLTGPVNPKSKSLMPIRAITMKNKLLHIKDNMYKKDQWMSPRLEEQDKQDNIIHKDELRRFRKSIKEFNHQILGQEQFSSLNEMVTTTRGAASKMLTATLMAGQGVNLETAFKGKVIQSKQEMKRFKKRLHIIQNSLDQSVNPRFERPQPRNKEFGSTLIGGLKLKQSKGNVVKRVDSFLRRLSDENSSFRSVPRADLQSRDQPLNGPPIGFYNPKYDYVCQKVITADFEIQSPRNKIPLDKSLMNSTSPFNKTRSQMSNFIMNFRKPATSVQVSPRVSPLGSSKLIPNFDRQGERKLVFFGKRDLNENRFLEPKFTLEINSKHRKLSSTIDFKKYSDRKGTAVKVAQREYYPESYNVKFNQTEKRNDIMIRSWNPTQASPRKFDLSRPVKNEASRDPKELMMQEDDSLLKALLERGGRRSSL